MDLTREIADLYSTWVWVRKSFIPSTSWVWVQSGARSTIWSMSSYSRKFYNLGTSLCQNHIIFVMKIYVSFVCFSLLPNEEHNKCKSSCLCVLGYTFCERTCRTLGPKQSLFPVCNDKLSICYFKIVNCYNRLTICFNKLIVCYNKLSICYIKLVICNFKLVILFRSLYLPVINIHKDIFPVLTFVTRGQAF